MPGRVPRLPPQDMASVMGASGAGMAMESLSVASSVTGVTVTETTEESQASDWEDLLFAVFSICDEKPPLNRIRAFTRSLHPMRIGGLRFVA